MAKSVVWVAGIPRSLQAKRKEGYVAAIREAAAAVVTRPSKSPRLDVEIVFASKDRNLRADVDNVAKPVLDALKGVAYEDDRQVRSVRVVALPLDDAFRTSGAMEPADVGTSARCEEFAIIVTENLPLALEFK